MGDGLGATSEELTSLASDLDDMQEYLKRKVDRLNVLVEAIEAGWRSPAARAYTELRRGVNEDAVTIRKNLVLIEAQGSRQRLTVEASWPSRSPVGRVMLQAMMWAGREAIDVHAARVVLKRDPSQANGFRVQTSFPIHM